ncbi:putative E3 ubiquitin-protein ligase XBAT35 isoform X2 [Punica granatum]|uniref:E3 ubiquitin-protein ligase XBAT35 isoform X2 n=1 Tax=Punica granatum TaxID=22663 RepID=A0A218WDD0_PUNGR|nr:putative E3 ubiquitin-protein ligase XBAT35 isoform X2 [Punica granatum]OWM70458.1 hypothetical protein CDL15_Pgr011934 [Punica granatum]
MGQKQSKDELLYNQVNYGNIEGIKALCRDGASLEWMDREGKTPLIVASLNPQLYDVAKTLVELGANVNAYRPGRNGGTPLHHAAKRGHESTVRLLLSHGANPLVMNDDCQTPLDVARAKGYANVVRTIEGHMCLFSGWMREFYGPGFLEALAPQLLSRKVWVVVYPCGSRIPKAPFKLELAIYTSVQDAQPRSVIALWKANLEDPKFYHTDTSVIIVDNTTKARIKLAPGNENEKVQLQWFCDACKGITQARQPAFLQSANPPASASAPPSSEDMELAMAINASIQTAAMHPEIPSPILPAEPSPMKENDSTVTTHHTSSQSGGAEVSSLKSAPSAPPVDTEITEDGPIHYPTIDLGSVDFTSPSPAVEDLSASTSGSKGEVSDKESSSCVICLDAPVEGACIPCGHMAGCMTCLNEIKAKKWGCPVCRAKINQIVRLYAV